MIALNNPAVVFGIFTSLLVVILLSLAMPSYADGKDDNGADADGSVESTETKKINTLVSRMKNGVHVTEEVEQEITYHHSPLPSLDGCAKSEGTVKWNNRHVNNYDGLFTDLMKDGVIRWDARLEGPKVLPELQEVVDSGAETLCIEIVLHNKRLSSLLNMSGWEETVDLEEGGLDNTLSFLKSNNASLLKNSSRYGATGSSISASIPATLLDELAARDDVANIDVYGKELWIPWHISNGYDSKIMPLLQKEIEHQKTNCIHHQEDFTECPPLEKNAEGKDIVNVSITLAPIPMWPDGWPDEQNYPTAEQRDRRFAELYDIAAVQQQPVVDLLHKNNQTVIGQDLVINDINADVATDFLPELEALDEVLFIDSRNVIYVSGSVDPHTLLDDDDAFSHTSNMSGSDLAETVFPDGNNNNSSSSVATVNVTSGDLSSTTTTITTTTTPSEEQNTAKSKPKIKSPLKQVRDGVTVRNVQCSDGLVLAVLNGDRAACLGEGTLDVLMSRGIAAVVP